MLVELVGCTSSSADAMGAANAGYVPLSRSSRARARSHIKSTSPTCFPVNKEHFHANKEHFFIDVKTPSCAASWAAPPTCPLCLLPVSPPPLPALAAAGLPYLHPHPLLQPASRRHRLAAAAAAAAVAAAAAASAAAAAAAVVTAAASAAVARPRLLSLQG
jgi:hypothetical protein